MQSSTPHHHRRRPRRHPTTTTNRVMWVPRGSSDTPTPTAPPPTTNPNHHRHRPAPPSDPAAISGHGMVPQLVQEIQDKLSRGAVECMICYDMVRRAAPVWSCASCFAIFHLHCIRKWARSPTSAADPTNTSSATWRCPGCQSIQSAASKDLVYSCFCGRRRDPPNDLYLTPHSCGEPCGRSLDRNDHANYNHKEEDNNDATRCPHVCVLQCHPGPCPPCKAFAPRRPCPCGKKTITRRCADHSTPVTCGDTCRRLLVCRRHRCNDVCHLGPCASCSVVVAAACFCGKKTEMVLCGDMAVKGDLEEVTGVFSCSEICGRKLVCGEHFCKDVCHPGPCGECEYLPGKITACHCGKTPLKRKRESCLDPIPTCDKVCGKSLPCGIHRCKDKCHEGECLPCLEQVEQKCRCGLLTRTVECYKVSRNREEFVCNRPCGRKKNCGRHRCNETCCPLSKPFAQLEGGNWDPHLCQIPCGKRLQCGQHLCQQLCHSGHCPPCLETIFTDLSCACGRTSIPPPLPCGTPTPSCSHSCMVPQPCGHAASHSCHFGDCPPCIVPVVKECIGGHVLLRNIPCGSKDIRCNQLCGKLRQCGMHACARTCHAPPCDVQSVFEDGSSSHGQRSSCGQVCGAPRRECKHTCTAPCHPAAHCPDLRCEFPVTITCSCGRITASVPCGTGGSSIADSILETTIIQKLPVPLQPVELNGRRVPLGQRKLSCDEECAKLERKRVLADAFDIAPPNLEALHLGENPNAADLLSDLLRREPKWVMAVEERCKFLVLGKTRGASASNLRVHVFCHMAKEKRDAVRIIAERWKLLIQSAGWEPKRFLAVHVTPKSKPPARILGAKPGIPVTASHPPPIDPSVDMDPRLVVAMLDLPREADVSALVLRFGGECELLWLNDKNALAVFGDPARAATALRRLDYGSAYQGAAVILPSGTVPGSSSSAWGPKDGGLAARSSTNPWKKALTSETVSWGGDWSETGSVAPRPVWRGNDSAQIVASTNPWHVLESDASSNLASGLRNEREVAPAPARVDNGSGSEPRTGTASLPVIKMEPDREVEDWEDACE